MKTYTTHTGIEVMYAGNPDFSLLDKLVEGPGDLWHSGLDQGYTDAFKDIIYQTATFWWYLNDFKNLKQGISWRVNPTAFVVRKDVWEQAAGFDVSYSYLPMQGLDFGYRLLRLLGGVPMYVKGLFEPSDNVIKIPDIDRYIFYRKHFKLHHSYYMMLRKGLGSFFKEYIAFAKAKQKIKNFISQPNYIKARTLDSIQGTPKVCIVIPTMGRQDFVIKLLEDYKVQTYLPYKVIVVDATPSSTRDESMYAHFKVNYNLEIYWQTSKGSCRARNEALTHCDGDYVIFADDDIRVLPNFIENHIRILQTYGADACNGLDIRAQSPQDDLNNLTKYLKNVAQSRSIVGAAQSFSNANSCVKQEWIDRIGGNDINYDGGYGEDGDFGISLVRSGAVVLHNPFSANLHLKPPAGGYRWWGQQAKLKGKKRKKQPWELNHPVRGLNPKPSPTVMYQILKFHSDEEVKEYKYKYFFLYVFKSKEGSFITRLIKLPKRIKQFKKSQFYAQQLLKLGIRHT